VQSNKGKVLAILGPTCTGKSDLALWLAPKVGGEIVNSDSMQVYRHFDIGSAKPDRRARAEVPHHLIDVVAPDEEFNAAAFQKAADDAIREVWSRGRTPILVGGTGLYLRVLFHGLFPVRTDPALRERLKMRYAENPLQMYEELKALDPGYALSISFRDAVRVVRALEVCYSSGTTMSEWLASHGFREERYEVYKVGLSADRRRLYERIDRRVERMLDEGWIGEVEALMGAGWDTSLKPFHSIGYREIVLYLKGSLAYAAMAERIKRETRHYGKRQITWFSKEKDIHWYDYPGDRDTILEGVRRFLA
jgi:tRNA dimethylallyltransferase